MTRRIEEQSYLNMTASVSAPARSVTVVRVLLEPRIDLAKRSPSAVAKPFTLLIVKFVDDEERNHNANIDCTIGRHVNDVVPGGAAQFLVSLKGHIRIGHYQSHALHLLPGADERHNRRDGCRHVVLSSFDLVVQRAHQRPLRMGWPSSGRSSRSR